jgi:polysaccharide export outer membrane protein
LLAALVLSGCASGGEVGSPISTLPPPDAPTLANLPPTDYRIGVLDTLDISVFQVEGLTRTVQVDAAGRVDFPLVGTLVAVGKTPRQLGEEIAAVLGRQYLQSPQVAVFLRASASRKFTVEGSVAHPGVFDLPGSMTLLQAIATAQGIDGSANPRRIVVFRTVNKQRVAAIADLAEIRAGKLPDPEIYPGDIIVVPRSGSRRVLQGIIGATPLVTLFRLGI